MTGAPRPATSPPRPGWFHIGSLQRRLVLAALVFVTAALVVAGLAIGLILQRFVRGQLDSRLDSQIVALASGLREGPGGAASLERDLDGPPFDRPRSGWYWQVTRGAQVLKSRSLRDGAIDLARAPAGRDNRPRPAETTGPRGEPLILRVLTLPGPGQPTTILAAAPAAALQHPVREALATLALALLILGLCLMGGVAAQVRLGLRPLDRLRGELAEVRAGHRSRVLSEQPAEVAPSSPRSMASSTRTPRTSSGLGCTWRTSPTGSRRRWRPSAWRWRTGRNRRQPSPRWWPPWTARCATICAGPAPRRSALTRIHADKAPEIAVAVGPALAVACDPQDIDEMLGNLIDNACQWCRSCVRVSAALDVDAAQIEIRVDDDGPGLDAAARAQVLRHGLRLDETVPGNGFGLPITLELAELYGGALILERSELGGLRARLRLLA